MKKLLTAVIAVVLAAVVATVFLLQHRASEKLRAQIRALAALNEQVTQFRVENEQLFRLAEQATQKAGRPAEAAAAAGWIRLGKNVEFNGMTSANQQHDGATEPAEMGGLECHELQRYPGRPELYAYFKIDSALKGPGTNEVIVEVEYFDADPGGHFRLDYDSYDESNRSLGAYTQSKEKAYLKGTQRWRKARFLIDDGRFEGRENDESDFRVTVVGPRFFLRSVKVMRE
jgi:type II secretory pathway pseudopilin PulG